MVLLVGVVSMMKGGSKRFVAVESKSFDLVVEGRGEDVLTITENAEEGGSLFCCLGVLLFGC